MRAKGWLRLERDEDRRSHLIEITNKGRCLAGVANSAEQQLQLYHRWQRLGRVHLGQPPQRR
jgi:hypothetical protein